jgi:phospholipid/cholesterol/gamma-HCH transport system permease protein
VAVTLGALGMVLVYQACMQVNRITGDLSMVGAEYIKGLVHEFVPSIMAQMLATRVGAGIAAEIGSMVVTEQVDALRMSGVEPIHYLIVPRFVASFIMTMVLYVFALGVCILTGALSAYFSFHVNPQVFVDFGRVGYGDVATGLIKCALYGAAIPIVAGYCGLAARGGSEGVGRATTSAVISAAFTCIVLDFIVSGFAYFTLQAGDAGPKGM